MNQQKIRNCILFCFNICFFMCLSVYSQKKQDLEIDSLIKILPQYMRTPDSLISLSTHLYEISTSHNSEKGKAFASKFLGIGHFLLSDHDLAKKYYAESLALFTRQKDSLETAKAFYNLATVYNAHFDYKETTENALKALKIFEKINDKNGMGRIYNLLGIAAHVHENYPKSIAYFKKYNDLVTLAGDSLEIATSYINLGGTYTEAQATDSAIISLKKAEHILELKKHTRPLASLYQNLGLLYEEKGNRSLAIDYLKRGLLIAEQEKNAFRSSNIHYNLGRIYKKEGQPTLAMQHLQAALEISKQTDDKQISYTANEQIAYLLAGRGLYQSAYDHLLDAKINRDSVFQIEQKKAIEELTAKYENEKKENEIKALGQTTAIQKLKIKQQTNLLLLSVVLLLAISISSFLLFKQRKLKAEALLQKKLKEQQEVAARDVLDAEEKERRRIAADLHDGVGQILSAALLNLREFDKDLKKNGVVTVTFLSNAIDLVQDSYTEMRQISHQMMPNILLKTGLANSVREFIQKLEHDRIQTNLEIVGLQERMDQQVETFLYRCIQEAVTNIIKHADANQLSIQLVKDEDGINLSIEDNGKGFDIRSLNFEEGIGLKNIRSRVAVLGGDLEISSIPNKGTTLMIHIP